ncbi:MAG: RNA polymerase sigma factor, partial [Chloroflexota bacterium]|nr:RNA polymerase sigma factor [Chloroflexota bacterium]
MLEPAHTSTPSALDTDTEALREAVQRAKNRDHAAFTLLYQHYKSLIWKRLIYLVGNKEIVYDLFQETFLRAWNKLPELRDEAQFGSWLSRIAANSAIDYLRHEKKIQFLSLPEDNSDEYVSFLMPTIAGPEEHISEAECIAQALAQMSPRYRICVLLQDQWGFSQREIAEILQISPKGVSAYVSRGR